MDVAIEALVWSAAPGDYGAWPLRLHFHIAAHRCVWHRHTVARLVRMTGQNSCSHRRRAVRTGRSLGRGCEGNNFAFGFLPARRPGCASRDGPGNVDIHR